MTGMSEATMPGARGGVLFDAVLYPHRSLSPLGFRLLMGAVIAVGLAAGIAFLSIGAWPVLGFFGLEFLLLYVAFRASYRRGRLYETVRLTADELEVRRVHPGGEAFRWSFRPPHWLSVHMDEPPRHESLVTLASHGRRVVVGSFLSPDERRDFARALEAALARLRRP
jgi:uncharacterized membrane protein